MLMKNSFNEWEKFHPCQVKLFLIFIFIGIFIFTTDCSKKSNIEEIQRMNKASLKSEYEKVKGSRSHREVDILNELSYRESKNGPKKIRDQKDALDYAQEALELAKNIDYQTGIFDSLCSLGLVFLNKSEYMKSKKFYQDVLNRLKENNKIRYNSGKAKAHIGIARCHQFLGEYGCAFDNFISSKKLSERICAKRELAHAYYGFGALSYYDEGGYEEALDYFTTCLGACPGIQF